MKSHALRLLFATTIALAFPADRPVEAQDEATQFFEMRIRPVLAKNCFSCHTNSQLGDLRLDSREDMLRGGKSGPALVPGDPDKSLLIQAVSHTHERLKMPMQGNKLKESEIADLKVWVLAGAIWPKTVASAGPVASGTSYVITPEQRAFWSFQPVRQPPQPPVKNKSWPKSAIDSFILAKLEAQGLQPAPPADKRTLIRRAYFDLIGLPPSPDDVESFVKDSSPGAFAAVVDRLLASPRYGERWGRYWLDVARYSDDKLDPTGETPYPNSFRYRDWVIQAFNDDMPYDLFVKAQIAGDQMEGQAKDKMVPGLGFYGLSPQFQDDRVDATTRGFLGLTVACAQCHDHKFDPIPTKDYYSILGVFRSTETHDFPIAPNELVSAYDNQKKTVDAKEAAIKDFLKTQSDQLGAILAARTARYLTAAAKVLADPKSEIQLISDEQKLDRETLERWVEYLKKPAKEHTFLAPWDHAIAGAASESEIQKIAEEFQALVLSVHAEKISIDDKNHIALGGSNERRDLSNASLRSLERDKYFLWRDLFAEKQGVLYYGDRKIDRFLNGEWKTHLENLRADLAALKKAMPPQYPFLHAIHDKKNPANIRVEIRGNADNKGEEAPRRFLAILSEGEPKPFEKGSGRLELADSIANQNNPLTARVMVNRIWQNHFGQGIVRTASNFGQLGDRPSHPELLDYLAHCFTDSGWSIKSIHRTIMLSATYGQSSEHSEKNFTVDPENRLLWRATRRRLDAEALRDSLLFVSGNLDVTIGGPATRMVDENRRRTVYGYVSRKKLDGMLSLFDFANPNNTSEARIATNVPLQRLYFMNSGFVALQAKGLAERISASAKGDEDGINQAYRLLFGRDASRAELKLGLDYLKQNNRAWSQYCQVLLSSNEFSFID